MKGLYKLVPSYLSTIKIDSKKLTYEWDIDFPLSLVSKAKEEKLKILDKISNFGIIAYTVACCEWQLYALSFESINDLPFFYLEAFWSYVMGKNDDFEYPEELNHDEWRTHEKSPIDTSICSIMNVIYLSQISNSILSEEAAIVSKITEHIISDKVEFLEWESKILKRLLKNHKRNEDSPNGLHIPRQIMDLNEAYDYSNYNTLINQNYKEVSFKNNPFYIGAS